MEKIFTIQIEKLPEGLYLATSDEIQGLVAQGRTITETLEIARDIAKKLFEAQENFNNMKSDIIIDGNSKIDMPIIIGF